MRVARVARTMRSLASSPSVMIAAALALAACGPAIPGNDNGDGGGNGDGDGSVGPNPCEDVTCGANETCVNGFCLTACEAADRDPSTVGCHFFAVDLDNSVDNFGGIMSDAAAQQYSVAVANVNDYPVGVSVYKNTAPFGQPPVEVLVTEVMVGANDLEQIDLPQREVDGTMAQNGVYDPDAPSGTFVSSHAYKIESTGPIVAYQFNPIIQQFSNDASILIPRQALGEDHLIMGWPTSNPCGAPPGDMFYFPGIPDHTYVTIVGVEEDTIVTVVPTHPVKASLGSTGAVIPLTPAGTPIELVIGPYDVVNLESEQPVVPIFDCLSYQDQDGDFSGTSVHSTKRVAVFAGSERSNGTGGADPPPPPGWEDGTCCTEHFEEQMFPITALGWNYAISRSPVRSGEPGYEEPDLYRILATVDSTVVITSLPAPNDQFTLNAGEFRTLYAYSGFTVESTGGAIMLGQYLLSQDLVPGGIGDPDFMVFPAVDQYRDHYVFLVPSTFQDNFMVVALPVTAVVDLDDSGEFPPVCDERPIGTIGGVTYKQVTCRLEPGVHTLRTSEPSGLSVYGHYSVGSYAYCGGSDVDIINPIE